ncbi:hypothetical protein FE782_11510 [Paenibacillus antri]|uniref:Uncharacterized protein n=1 Tax=Paenibacillus antri TaxID=2582848 RepID=A0A5R9GD39_9BACL|nr:hypothetical protein [Paenibacillus antri]TLS52000.1 hypothetical protein FE782_11510 [Paenibacillus antri]
MKVKSKVFIKNLSYSFSANLISLLISTILILVVPSYIGLLDYGYWQLYMFYTSFIAYLSFGLTDGAYLRYGGYEYHKLHKPVFVSQYWFLVALDVVALFLIMLFISYSALDISKKNVIFLACLNGVIIVPRSLLIFTLQTTNKVKESSIIIIIEKVVYFAMIIIILASGNKRFELLIYSDLVGKISSLLFSYVVCKDLVFGRYESFKNSVKEIAVNISAGSKLMIANLASMLIIGIVRLYIERSWSIETFGKISFTLSISSMALLFINSIGLVLFPTLRRLAYDSLPTLYGKIRPLIGIPLTAFLTLYFPLKGILYQWLPEYRESLVFMAILFPMFIYESKMNMLIATFLKALRKEKHILIINLIVVVASLIITLANALIIKNLYFSIFSIVALLAIRCVLAEELLCRLLKLKFNRDTIFELVISVFFIIIALKLSNFIGFLVYTGMISLYFFLKKDDLLLLWSSSLNKRITN